VPFHRLGVSMILFYPFTRFVPYSIRWVWVNFFFVNLFDIGKGKKFISLSKWVNLFDIGKGKKIISLSKWVRVWVKIIS
jgi:hypothetical protein